MYVNIKAMLKNNYQIVVFINYYIIVHFPNSFRQQLVSKTKVKATIFNVPQYE